MKYTLIKGHFYAVGYSPDPDSIKFKASDPTLWNRLEADDPDKLRENLAKEDGIITLRLQGIDGLETHYAPTAPHAPADANSLEAARPDATRPKAGTLSQPGEHGKLATTTLLELVGVRNAVWKKFGKASWINKAEVQRGGSWETVTRKGADRIPGYIFTRDAEKNGRPIAWVLPGHPPDADGTEVDAATLGQKLGSTVNYQLLASGLVYPYFFMTLPALLRAPLAEAARQARAAAQTNPNQPNLWRADHTLGGATLTDVQALADKLVVIPYLYRKLTSLWFAQRMERYWADLRGKPSSLPDTALSLNGLFAGGNPYVFIVSEADFVRLDTVVLVKGDTLQLRVGPEDIVFLG